MAISKFTEVLKVSEEAHTALKRESARTGKRLSFLASEIIIDALRGKGTK